jgi:hypothetical protein
MAAAPSTNTLMVDVAPHKLETPSSVASGPTVVESCAAAASASADAGTAAGNGASPGGPCLPMPLPRRFAAFAFDAGDFASYTPLVPSCPIDVPPRRTASLPATRLPIPSPRAPNPMVQDRRFRLAVADARHVTGTDSQGS